MVEKHHEAVVREYRRLAGDYDRRWGRYVEATIRESIARLPVAPGDRLLDIACGTGALLRELSERHPSAALAGVDVSAAMLEVAAAQLPQDIDLREASADALPFGDQSFDTVVTTNAFHFFRQPEVALSEMARVLRPGGCLVITDWCDDFFACWFCDRMLRLFSPAHHRIYSAQDCQDMLQTAAFGAVEVERYKINWLWGMMTASARRADDA